MSTGNESNAVPQIVYKPQNKETVLVRFQKFVQEKYSVEFKNYWELHQWTYENFPQFWECVWIFFDVRHSVNYSEVYDKKNDFLHMEWFKGARINYSQNIFKFRDSHTALIATDSNDNAEYITYKQMYDEVRVYAAALRKSGVQKGDTVACYMSNKKEAVFAFLATAAIGALWSGCLPLLGARAVIARIEQLSPKVLFTAGNFFFECSEIKMMEKIPVIVQELPEIQKVVFVSKPSEKVDISQIPRCVSLSVFLSDVGENCVLEDLKFEQVPFDYPLCVSFTSGTTGAPKGLLHSHGNFFAQLKDYGLHQDITRKDVLFNFSPVGWISWNMFVNTLHLGVTLCMYDGYPFDESPNRYYDLIDKYSITSFYIWSSTVDDMDVKGHIPQKRHSLKSLRQLFPMGSPAKPRVFNFLTEKVKPGLFCSPIYGSTEVFGMLSGLDCNMPVYRGEIQAISLGMDFRILDDNEEAILGVRGDAVLANPYPALPVSILNDSNKKMMKELYLTEHPSFWNIGDDAWRNPITKGLIVYGRSDETMNPKGARFNCSEIYFALHGFPGIEDSVCTSQFNSNLDERVVLFVKMSYPLTEQIKIEIRKKIEYTLSIEHVPELIIQVPDIPYNLTGKKLNSLVKKLINKKPVKNADVVVNPDSVIFYRNLNLEDF